MSWNVRAIIDPLRSLAFGGISGTYAPVGPIFAFPVRLICITNNTDGDMIFTDDGVTDKLFIASFSFKLFDISSNAGNAAAHYALPMRTQISVKQSTAATKGSVYV